MPEKPGNASARACASSFACCHSCALALAHPAYRCAPDDGAGLLNPGVVKVGLPVWAVPPRLGGGAGGTFVAVVLVDPVCFPRLGYKLLEPAF